MNMRIKLGLLIAAAIVVGMSVATPARGGELPEKYAQAIKKQLARIDKGVAAGPYKADWKDLEKHEEAPEWFRDAKFGIYWHWGVYSVPAHGNEWYPRRMHKKSKKDSRRSYYNYHLKTYGQPDEFGYHDFVPMFKAEKFDADEWAELCKKAGAKYAGPVVEHHDGFSLWDSDITPWNSVDKGPRKDFTGLLEKAIRKRGMKFVTTFHHERTKWWYPRPKDKPDWPVNTTDPVLRMLYANVSDETYYEIFLAKLGEVIDKYHPDLIWHDGKLDYIKDSYHKRYLAYYFNSAKKWDKDVVVTSKHRQYPPEVSVLDIERGRAEELTDYCWLTDDSISQTSWCYTKNLPLKTTSKVLHDFIDIVSKNGCLLFNIAPKADGTIPDDQKKILLEMGAWLDVNGEAIYDTRPWLTFGEGPTRMKDKRAARTITYTAKDIRYTRSKDNENLYAIVMGWPEDKTIVLESVKVVGKGKVMLLGYKGTVKYKLDSADRPVINVPDLKEKDRPCKYAYVFKLSGFKTALHPAAKK